MLFNDEQGQDIYEYLILYYKRIIFNILTTLMKIHLKIWYTIYCFMKNINLNLVL